MGKHVHREVIKGHMTVTQGRRAQGVRYVESIVYAGPEEEGEPVAEWEFPHQLRLYEAAQLAVAQTEFPPS